MDAITSISDNMELTPGDKKSAENEVERTEDFEETHGGRVRKRPDKHSGKGYMSRKDAEGWPDKPPQGGPPYNYTSRDERRKMKEPHEPTPEEATVLYEQEEEDKRWDAPLTSNEPTDPVPTGSVVFETNREDGGEEEQQTVTLTDKQAQELERQVKKEKYFGRDR